MSGRRSGKMVRGQLEEKREPRWGPFIKDVHTEGVGPKADIVLKLSKGG